MSRTKHKKKHNPAITIILTIIILLVVYLLFGYLLSKSERTFPNILANEIQLGGMNREEICETLKKNSWENFETNDLEVITFCHKSISINPVSSGVLSTADSVTDAALTYGKQDSIFKVPVNYINCLLHPTDINSLSTTLNEEYIDSKIDSLQFAVDSAVSTYSINEDAQELVLVKGFGSGLKLDKADLFTKIVSALEKHESVLEYFSLLNEPKEPDFNSIHELVCTQAQPASFSQDGSHTIIERIPGYSFDVSEAAQLWSSSDVGEEIHVPLQVSYSDVTADVLKSNMYVHLLGAMTTKYNNSNDNRSSNVRLATSLVNGVEIYPGEEFSFNKTVGKRTEEAGFLMAPAYAGYDDIQEELGGGVCQVSTGIYASALFAFLDITSHTCHIYPPNYIQLGTDATVSIPDAGREIDLKIRNNKSYPIMIVGYCEETENPKTGKPLKTVTIEIWGTLEDEDYMPVEFDNAWGDVYDYDRIIEPAYEDREGYRLQFTHDETEFEDDTGKGLRTLTYRRVYDSHGNLVEKKTLNPMYSFGYGMDTYYYKS